MVHQFWEGEKAATEVGVNPLCLHFSRKMTT